MEEPFEQRPGRDSESKIKGCLSVRENSGPWGLQGHKSLTVCLGRGEEGGFPGGSAGKESACKVGDLGFIPGLGRSPGEGKRLPTPVFWPEEFRGQNSYTLHAGRRELDTTERLSLSDFSSYCERVSKSSSDRCTLKAHLFCLFLSFRFWWRANRRPPVGAHSLMLVQAVGPAPSCDFIYTEGCENTRWCYRFCL